MTRNLTRSRVEESASRLPSNREKSGGKGIGKRGEDSRDTIDF